MENLKDTIPIKTDAEKIEEQMEEMRTGKYEAFSAVITAWEEWEKAKFNVKKQEAIIKLELKVADPKMTVDMMGAKVINDDRYDGAIAKEIETEAYYKLAENEFDNYKDGFEILKSKSYMLGKI